MRIPGFNRRKSSKNASDDAQTAQPSEGTQSSFPQPGNSSEGNLGELGVLAAPRSSTDQGQGISTKRSIFRRGHSRSLSQNAQTKLEQAEPVRPVPATISAAAGGHPLRQQTLPQDLQPVKSKRPLLFAKRAATTAPASSPYGANSSTISVQATAAAKTSPPHELVPQASASSDSFQLRSFRATTGVREEQPTLSSLVDEEYVASPFSTRPNSPSPSPNPGAGSGSYFDNLPSVGQTVPAGSGGHERGFSSGSISVAKFREARAARSSSSLASTERNASTGLKLDLPPPLSMDYARPVLASIQPATQHYASIPASPVVSYPVSAPAFSTTFQEAELAQPSFSTDAAQMETLSSPVPAPRSPRPEALSSHPDNALPLPPVPSEPKRSFQTHSRRDSSQSVTSLSSAFGGWLNNTTANLGIAFSVEDVQKAINTGASALKSSIPASQTLNKLDKPFNPKYLEGEQEEETLAGSHTGPTQDELDELLGGKVLPPPPSQTDDELRPPTFNRSGTASPSRDLSRTSSLTNLSVMNGLSTAKNLFSSGIARVAKPAKDDDDTASDVSVDMQASKPFGNTLAPQRNSTAKKTKLFGDSSSDEGTSENDDSDDSDVERKRREKGRVFPPPRPLTQKEREQVYKTAQTPPTLSPRVSQSDLRYFANPLVQPVPPLPALTTGALNAFDDDEEENTPLSALRGRRAGAVSELGFSHRQAGPSFLQQHGPPRSPWLAHPSFQNASNPGSYAHPPPAVHNNISPLASASMTSLPLASESMGRSLSAFSSTASDIAINPRQYQRSSSSQALPSLTKSDLPPSVTLKSLNAAKVEKAGQVATGSTGQNQGPTSLPSSSSESSSMPKTPSDVSVAPPNGKKPSEAPPSFIKQHRSTTSDFGVMSRPAGPRAPSSTISPTMRHSKTSSVPLVKFDNSQTANDRMRERHRAEARQSGMVQLRDATSSAPPHQGSFASSSAPQVLQDFPPPPGVDPQLYASLPADQKQALQLRSQQMLSMMQGFATQAQSDALGRPAQFGQPLPQAMSPNFHPQMQMPMQLPMMGGQFPSMPSFPSFYGYPMFQQSAPQIPHVQHPYVPQISSSFSTVGMPTMHQQMNRNQQTTHPSFQGPPAF